MGKKKHQKTKELSVAIAEASSTGDEAQQQPQAHTPRKRGRPRKIIEKAEGNEEEQSEALAEQAAVAGEEDGKESQNKKSKAVEAEGEHQQQTKVKEEGASSGKKEEVTKAREPSRSRAKRKSKPRKSSQN